MGHSLKAGGTLLVFVLVVSSTAQAGHISLTNKAGSGFDAAETKVVEAAIQWWEMLILDMDPGTAGIQGLSVEITETAETGIGATFDFMEAGGIPTSAKIDIDDGTNFTFFVDPTPHENSEFNQDPMFVHHFTPKAGGPAAGKVDLLEVVKHELGHAFGFSEGYTLWAAASNNLTGVLTYALGKTATLQGTANFNELSHLEHDAHPHDLMADVPLADITGGHRYLQSQLDLDILSGIFGYSVDSGSLHTIPEPTSLALLGTGIFGLVGYRWRRRKTKLAA